MPLHDWNKAFAGVYHSFHCGWVAELAKALNQTDLPQDYYALCEQSSGEGPPQVEFTRTVSEIELYARMRRTVSIRHASNDEVVAIIEILSPGNKSKRKSFETLLDKALSAIEDGCHLLLVDLFPPGSFDPSGIHGAVWDNYAEQPYAPPADKRLTLASYSAGDIKRAYVQPIDVGDTLPDMPLFLQPEWYVNAPLERTYTEAYRGVPRRWREMLEA